MKRNLVGGFEDGDFVLSVDLGLDLLPDLSLVLEKNPENQKETEMRPQQITSQLRQTDVLLQSPTEAFSSVICFTSLTAKMKVLCNSFLVCCV